MEIKPRPLPKEVDFDADGRSAWNLLLSAEEAAGKEAQRVPKYQDHLVAVRVLGFLIDFFNYSASHSLFMIPYKRLLLEVKSYLATGPITDVQFNATQHAKIFELGLSYRNNLMRVFRSNTGPVPVPSLHASRPSFDKGRLEMIERMQKANKTKSEALLRDGYKCVITGRYDVSTAMRFPEIGRKVIEGERSTYTECVHLFSESAQDTDKPREYAATAFTMLKMFGLDNEVKMLLGGQVNSLSNVLTLGQDLHQAFDRFNMWLEEVPGQEHTYEVIIPHPVVQSSIYPSPPKHVTFGVDPDSAAFCEAQGGALPTLPSRALIAIRAACARVAHMSGAVEQADQIHQDKEDSAVLAHDGSAGDLLTSLLNARVVSVGA